MLSTASWCRRSRARPMCTSSKLALPARVGARARAPDRARAADREPAGPPGDRGDRGRERAQRDLIFGPGDFAASLGVPQLSVGESDPALSGDQWHYALTRIVTTRPGRSASRRLTARTRRSATWRDSARRRGARTCSASTASGSPPGPDRSVQRGLHAERRAVRAGRTGAPGLRGERESRGRCGAVRRRDDRRGLAEDGGAIAVRGRAARADAGMSGPLADVRVIAVEQYGQDRTGRCSSPTSARR